MFFRSEAWWFTKREKCYHDIGCFNNRAPFDNLHLLGKKYLPKSPGKIQPRFYLFTRENQNLGKELHPDNQATVFSSNFDPAKKTVFIIHGFSASSTDYRLVDMKEAFLTKFNYNIIMVDWSPGANNVCYLQAAANTRVVGAVTARLLRTLRDEHFLSYTDVHMVGHSLGAHTCGYVGRRERGISRITGLDPAGPFFEDSESPVRLDPSDAMFVDAIHTDGRKYFGLGIIRPVGHVDFYPNNGKHQPACKSGKLTVIKKLVSGQLESLSKVIACSHMRSILLFTESIRSACRFKACKRCSSCEDKCTSMGQNVNDKARGRYYLTTNSASPFCQQ
ncbi:inactive pancreatic lipase-related protein 1-like [Saccostrea echinata]|uniref:inactive pancreatic lipase-related protein 1-like n=1 Tax=Saccostrea echinata TaxID=191078 RepID=UPI002A7F7CBA|nr:inactive pancreatic lipase-related protein 1-like [Saccostrea echinata]